MSAKLLPLFILLSFCAAAQSGTDQKFTIFIDCSGIDCDEKYIKSEIRIVDFLRERKDADVHILITARTTGGEAEQYKLIFYGQNKYAGYLDTLIFSTKQNATDAERREQLVQYIKSGLVPLLNKTPFINSFSIDMKNDTGNMVKAITQDKWNYFVFNVGGDGEYSADQNYTSAKASGSLSINRTTEKTRFVLSGYLSKYYSVYKFEDSSGTKKYEVNNSDYGAFQYSVFSLGEHISIGYFARYSNNTFSNFKTKIYFNPVLELNIFKYKDINNRSFIFRYGVDITHFQYYDTTIYNKKKELLLGHEVSLTINFNQKWGTFSSGVYYRNYFSSSSFNSMGGNVTFNIRLFAGLTFYVSANGNIIHDQVYLPKGGATEQEVLIRKRQLKSSFDYYTSGGLYYRFGSKLNNFVNPRMSGYRGF